MLVVSSYISSVFSLVFDGGHQEAFPYFEDYFFFFQTSCPNTAQVLYKIAIHFRQMTFLLPAEKLRKKIASNGAPF